MLMARTRTTYLTIAVGVPLAVLLAGVVERHGGPPSPGPIPGAHTTNWSHLVAFIGATVATGILGFLFTVGPEAPGWFRIAAALTATFAVLAGQPTYATLLFALPLIDIRRRQRNPRRAVYTIAILGLMAFGLVQDRRDHGAQPFIAWGIAALLIMAVGDLLRQLDDAATSEAELARLGERQRLAQDLHDSMGHLLLASSIQLRKAVAFRDRDPAKADEAIELASGAIAEALVDLRIAVDGAHADTSGFSLSESLRNMVGRLGPSMSVDLDLSDDADVALTTQITLYRCAQEGLTNVLRHAEASSARLSTSVTPSTASVTVADNGRGFDATVGSGGAGLKNLRERLTRLGGSLVVRSSPGAGTVLVASLPR